MKRGIFMRSQRGMALIISIPIILLGLLLSVGVLTFMNYSNRRTTIQSAIDVSLINAAHVICSSISCWDTSRAAFLESLQANLKNFDFSFVNFSETDVDGYPVTSWEFEGTKISIDRVRFKFDDSSESLEKSWQRDHPGVPVHLVQYGLKVSFETELDSLAEKILPLKLKVKAQGTVAAGPLRAPCVAPFAIKACALLKESGDLEEANICSYDRRFGPSNGYCRPGERCLQVSPFDYDPLNEAPFSGVPSYPNSLFPSNFVKYFAPKNDEACFYSTPRIGAFRSGVKDQNIVGLPGDSVIANETLLQNFISDEGGCIPAGIDQTFQILHDGFRQETTAKILWDQISNSNVGGVTDANHRPLEELTDRGEININFNSFFEGGRASDSCRIFANSGNRGVFEQFARGVFSSFRSGFGIWSDFDARSKLDSGLLKCPWADDKFNSTFWKTVVPVIADMSPNAEPCGGILGASEDPLIKETSQYKIVGFAPLNIFDVGYNSAELPSGLGSNALQCARMSGSVDEELPNFPFVFRNQDGVKVEGVQVRGRIECGAKTFGGASAALGEAVPVLIE